MSTLTSPLGLRHRGAVGRRHLYVVAVLASNPVAYWRLGESSGTTAVDEIGGHDGTYVGSPTLGVEGAIADEDDTAIEFDAETDRVDLGPPVDFGIFNDAFTVETWIQDYGTSNNAFHRFLDGGAAGSNIGWSVNAGNASNEPMTVNVQVNDGSVHNAGYLSGGSFNFNQWVHVVWTHDPNGTDYLYVDGVEVDSNVDTSLGDLTASSHNVFISDQNGSQALVGRSDEVAFYDRALTATEIADHYAAAT